MTPARDAETRAARSVVVVLALLVLVRHAIAIAQSVEFLVAAVTVDDTYYYVKTVWNHRALGFPTFDGIHPTNGVQLGWYLPLYVVSFFFRDDLTFLRGVLALEALAGGLAVVMAYRVGELVPLRWFGLLLAAIVAGANLATNTTVSGMGLGVSILVQLVLLRLYLRTTSAEPRAEPERAYIVFVVAVIGSVWIRLDTALFGALLTLHASLRLWQSHGARLAVRGIGLATVLAAAGAGGMLWLFYAMGGSVIPVSALWKQAGGAPASWSMAGVVIGRPLAWVLPSMAKVSVLSIPAALLLLTAASLLVVRTRRLGWLDPFALLLWFGAAVVHQAATIVSIGHYAVYPFWYQAPFFVALGLAAGLLVCTTAVWLEDRRTMLGRLAAVALLAAFVIQGLGAAALADVSFLVGSRRELAQWRSQRLAMARWIDRELPADARLCGYNVGELGFYSRRAVINLDGLINSYDYFRFRQEGGDPRTFCRSSGARYFVDYAGLEGMRRGSTVRHALPMPGGGMIMLLDLGEPEPWPG